MDDLILPAARVKMLAIHSKHQANESLLETYRLQTRGLALQFNDLNLMLSVAGVQPPALTRRMDCDIYGKSPSSICRPAGWRPLIG